jgi:hypothetical protein
LSAEEAQEKHDPMRSKPLHIIFASHSIHADNQAMTITLQYGTQVVPSFDALLDQYPLNHFNSPRRSTVPLLAYWKEQGRCEEFLFHLAAEDAPDIQPPDSLTLIFEYEVPVQEGKGAPSCTDLMLVGDKLVVAVEAKYSEPDYETVREWLRKSNPENRRAVLHGWLALINETTGSQLAYGDVLETAYQVVHRTASACFPHKGAAGISRFMVYQIFEDSDGKVVKIVRDLAALEKMMPPGTLQLGCLVIPLEKQPAVCVLEARWVKEKERLLRDEVRDGLRQNRFFVFAKPMICRAADSSGAGM